MNDPATALEALASLIARHTPHDGEFSTAVGNLYLGRQSTPSAPHFTVQWPCFALVALGAKTLALGADVYRYGVGDFLVVSVDLPVRSSVAEATAARPHLGIGLAIDPRRLGAVLERIDVQRVVSEGQDVRGVSVNRATPELVDATLRLVRLLDRPQDIPALGPLIEEEILYRLVAGPCGRRLLRLVSAGGEGNTVVRAIRWLRENFTHALRIEDLARSTGMSVSSLHHHFKAVTGMPPLQYQKQLRLQEARRLMRVERLDVTTAGFRVGYQSSSQFSREYARLFGVSPRSDLRKHQNDGRPVKGEGWSGGAEEGR